MSTQIFRKVALERLSSPDELDQLMHVTSPRGWIALAATALLLVSALLWAILVTIPTTVSGRGVLVGENTGGYQAVVYLSYDDAQRIALDKRHEVKIEV